MNETTVIPQSPPPSHNRLAIHAAPDESEVNFRELFDFIWSGRWIVATVAATFLLISAIYALSQTPIYQANGLLQIEKEKGSIESELKKISSSGTSVQAEVPAETAILKSRMVLGAVVKDLKTYISVQPRYFPILGAAIARRYPARAELAKAPFNLVHYCWGGERIRVTAFDVPEELYDRVYTLEAGQPGEYALIEGTNKVLLKGKVGERATTDSSSGSVSIFVQELSARPGSRFSLAHLSNTTALAALGSAIAVVEQPKSSGILLVTANATDPEFAAKLVNGVSDAYLRQNVERRSAQAERSLEFLSQQLPKLRANVDEAQARLNAYQSKKGSVDVKEETGLILNRAVALESERLKLSQERDVALQRYTGQHPVIQGLNDQISGLENEQATIKKQIGNLPETQQEILGLMRDLEVAQQLYTTLLNSSQELQVTKAGTTGNVRIIDYALIPRLPIKPNKKAIMLAGLVLGFFLGIATVFGLRTLNRGVDRPEQLELALGLATYASIPYSQRQKAISRQVASSKGTAVVELLAVKDGSDLAIEGLRSLRTSLHFAMMESANNIVMFTGPVAGLGKSFITLNLGAVLAMAGKRVVVVDADLRRGRLHKVIGTPKKPGLSDLIAEPESELGSVIRTTSLSGLDFIGNGTTPPNPSEILMNERFSKLLRELSERYDYVLLDTPPVLPVTDAAIIGQLAGTTLLVLKASEHPMRTIEETVRRLRQAGIKVRGAIFNQVGAKVGSYGYGDYGYTYGYSSHVYRSEPGE